MKRKFANFLINLPRQVKRLLSLGFDLSVSLFCTFGFLLIVTNDTEQLSNTQNLTIAALLASLQIGALWASGTYQTVARFLGLKSLAKSSLFLLSVNAFIFVSFSIFGVGNIPNSLGVAQPALFFSFFLGSRFLVAILLSKKLMIHQIVFVLVAKHFQSDFFKLLLIGNMKYILRRDQLYFFNNDKSNENKKAPT